MLGLATSMAVRNQELMNRYQPQMAQSFAGNQNGLSSNTKFKGWDGKEGFAAAGNGSKGNRQQAPFFAAGVAAVNSRGDVKMALPEFLAAVLQPVSQSLKTFWQRFGATQIAEAENPKAAAKREWLG